MQTELSGSLLTEDIINTLKDYIVELDAIMAFNNMRIFSFPEKERYLFDQNTMTLVLVRRGSTCYIESITDDKATVTVGSCLFNIDKCYLKEIAM